MASQLITPSRAKELANDSSNVVYEYEFDTVQYVKKAVHVESLLYETFQEYLVLRNQNPQWSDNHCRFYLCSKHYNDSNDFNKFADFQKSHPRFFETMTNRNTTQKELVPLFKMIELKKKEERREITANEASQINQQFQLEYWNTGLTEEEYNKIQEKEELTQKQTQIKL
jgi:hypothetical protein